MNSNNNHKAHNQPSQFDGLTPAESEEFSGVINRINLAPPPIIIDDTRVANVRKHLVSHARSTKTRPIIYRIKRPYYIAAAACFALLTLISAWIVRPETIDAPMTDLHSLILKDGSEIDLGPGSSMTYRPGTIQWFGKVYVQGDAFFSMKSQKRPFRVQTDHATIHVMGTQFSVKNTGDSTHVYLFEGKVSVTQQTGSAPPIMMSPGELATATASSLTYTPLVHAQLPTWRERQPSFSDLSLQETLDRIQQLYAIKITPSTDVDLKQRINYFSPGPVTVEVLLSDICRLTNLVYRPVFQGYEILTPL